MTYRLFLVSRIQQKPESKRLLHAGLSYEELQEIEKIVRKKVVFDKVIYQKASSAISINCGMGAFGILFRLKDRGE